MIDKSQNVAARREGSTERTRLDGFAKAADARFGIEARNETGQLAATGCYTGGRAAF